jgi:hypothetical protein
LLVEEEPDDAKKAQILCGLAEIAVEIGHAERALGMWRAGFNGAEMRGRDQLCLFLGRSAPVIAAVDHGATLWAIYNSIREIENWWGSVE